MTGAAMAALVVSAVGPAHAQSCGTRAAVIAGGYVVTQAAGIALRHDDWWKGRPRAFHVIWGRSNSQGQDAMLHGAVSYQLSRASAEAWRWACASPRAAAWLGAVTAVAIALPKELGDGIHANGFSGTDMGWTAAGALLPALHRQLPKARVATVKAWYWPSRELRNRTGPLPQLENDYAGQRFYLSLNPARAGGAGAWPDWLGVAIGHGIQAWASEPPKDHWFVALDVDLRALPVQASWWRPVAGLLDQIHFPSPGLRFADGGIQVGLF